MEHGTNEYIHEQSEYTRYYQICTRDKYTNIRITSMTLGETGMEVGDELYTFPELTSQKPLVIDVTFYGDMITYGLLLTDANGVEHQYMIYESGEDGSVVFQEY